MIFRELKRAAQMLILWWYMWMMWMWMKPRFVFIPNLKCNQDFQESILETLSISEKVLKILSNIFGNVNAAGRLNWLCILSKLLTVNVK